ncbi:hypothetical protein [Deinococcus aquaedulcis]|uniref:hypothetical protein n=1 Tax=Deinococcus aquaedulcis TaxID=2840455 RepID=UPI001C83436F|nr:hypothetical protein [Deinococcus aquaedulcis]
MTKEQKPSYTFLSDIITTIPIERRKLFISGLKTAIRTSVIEGAPIADTFELTFIGLDENRKDIEKTAQQHDFAIHRTPTFDAWLAKQQATTPKRGGVSYPTKASLAEDPEAFAKAMQQYRKRGGKAKARR